METKTSITVHDPIHGSIGVARQELALLDSRPMQRLRHIKQLGFAELAFPGATHSRFAHSLGAMHVATRVVDQVLGTTCVTLPRPERRRLREAVRLASLFHDLGHPPLSHVSERVMPKLAALHLPAHVLAGQNPTRQASHEDYTLKLLYDSELTDALNAAVGDVGVTPDMLAALILGRHVASPAPFTFDGVDLLPLLSAITSSELDADRMDYLRRDAYSCGVSYGNFDHVWLCNHLTCIAQDGEVSLGLQHKAVWAFENYLLARYHMFLAVYYHHTSLCFDHLLGRFYAEGEYTLPSDSEAYLGTDDVDLYAALRRSKSPWARAVVQRRPWKMLVETHDFGEATKDGATAGASGPDEHERAASALREAGIDSFTVQSKGALSKYFGAQKMTLKVVEPERNRVRSIEAYTPLFRRFDRSVNLVRLYCRPDDVARARQILTLRP